MYPESQMPLDYFFLGEMRNDASHNCLDTMGRKSGEEVKKRTHWKKYNFNKLTTGGNELLPRFGWKSGVCLHQAAAGIHFHR